jgi:hypothetical protein
MVLFYNILDVSGVNAFIIWTHLNPDWHKNKTHRRRLFLKQLGKDLVEEHLRSRLETPGLSAKLRNMIEECVMDVNQSSDDPCIHNVANKDDMRHDRESSRRPTEHISFEMGCMKVGKGSNSSKLRTT